MDTNADTDIVVNCGFRMQLVLTCSEKNKPSIWVQFKDKLYLHQIQPMWPYYQRAPVIVWTTLALAGFYIQARQRHSFVSRSEARNSAFRGSEMPKLAFRHFGSPICRYSAYRLFGRNADLGNQGHTQKKATLVKGKHH